VSVAALIVAAGRGSRAAVAGEPPKQYAMLGDRTVLARSIEALAGHSSVAQAVVVIHPDDDAAYESACAEVHEAVRAKLLPPAHGGATRQESVRLGLEALGRSPPALVLIHDAARPFVGADVIDRVVAALADAPGAIAAVPLTDTLKRADADGRIAATLDRTGLWRAQTPQGFQFTPLRQAHARAHAAGRTSFTDDAALAEWAGLAVALVPGNDRNVKLTTVEDMAMAGMAMAGRPLSGAPAHREAQSGAPRFEMRSGTGFDVHRFAEGSSVWLCGVEIAHTQRLEGHSDADVGLHALTDALLGAIGAGDIGVHFPPSDMRWKGAASHVFLRHAAALVNARGGRIVNVDVTILAEAPRIGPHRAEMCASMAGILGLAPERVSVKATTTEGLGFTGRREGIAAMATASVELPLAASTDHWQPRT
jgi:2-C-methyl-D-erythritol 4-phosphate cytidylyltransferase/2-C-methyl-D-erythritol 2,4-cyclodiphosphate synthase